MRCSHGTGVYLSQWVTKESGMSDSLRVLLVCADRETRTRLRDRLVASDAVAEVDAAAPGDIAKALAAPDHPGTCDRVVGVPETDPVAFAADLVARTVAPVVVYGAGGQVRDVLAAGATEVVGRDGDESGAILVHRLEQVGDGQPTGCGPVAADGGTASDAPARPDPPEDVTEGFATVDEELVVTSLDEVGRELLGVEGAVGEYVWEVLPGEPGRIRERFEQAVGTATATTVESYDGDRDRWFESRAYPAGESDREGLSVFVRDVTERKRALGELQASERALQRLHGIAADADCTRAEKIERMLAAGCERLDVDSGFLTRIEDDTQEIVQAVGSNPALEPGSTTPLSEAYCRHTIGREEPLGITDAATELSGDPAYERFGLACYLGATIFVDGDRFGTVCFAGSEPRATAFTDSERTFVDLLTDWISYVLEQRAYEAEIRTNQQRLETVLENVPIVVFALDPDGIFTLARGRGLESLGIQPGQAVGESVFDLYADYPEVVDHAERALAGEEGHHTVELDEHTLEVWYRPVVREDGLEQVVGVARDVSAVAAHRKRLSGLLETTRSLMQARSREEVAELVASAAGDVLGFDINVVRLYDADTGTLRPAATTAATDSYLGERPVYDVGEGIPGEVFATGESRIVEDVTDVDDGDEIRSAMYYPMGVHGTISVGSTDEAAFEETDERVLALLATAAAAACIRAKRESEVREAREHVETVLDRVNGLIENTVEVLVGATTREELEAGVVAELAAAEPHTFAWIGRPDVPGETLSPADWAGEAPVPTDVAFDLDGSNAVARALDEGIPRVVAAGEEGAADLGCRDDRGTGTAIVVPLSYKETTYGVLAVFAADPNAFDEREQVVLSALGRAVANATNAIERGRILDADEVIELEFAVDSPDLLFGELSRRGNCTVEVADTDYRSDGNIRLYLTADAADGEGLAAAASESEAVSEARLITDNDAGCLLEVTVEESLVGQLSERGAVVREVVAEGGTTRVTVELPYEAEARDLFEMVDDRYAGTDLVGYHEHERPVETRQEFRSALADRFTDRQETALRTAYLGGFFDWPRGIDGNELADAMDISRPTYHQHLRAAQRKVLEELFE
jgi:predicted DNA binding protein/PAS domain-containing protein